MSEVHGKLDSVNFKFSQSCAVVGEYRAWDGQV